jgi:hypothetical protein
MSETGSRLASVIPALISTADIKGNAFVIRTPIRVRKAPLPEPS